MIKKNKVTQIKVMEYLLQNGCNQERNDPNLLPINIFETMAYFPKVIEVQMSAMQHWVKCCFNKQQQSGNVISGWKITGVNCGP